MKNNRGLSGIVTTLIIILLILAAVAALWGPIQGLIGGSTSTMEKTTICSGVDIQAEKLTKENADFNVTLKRSAGGDAREFMVKVGFESNGLSSLQDFDTGLGQLARSTKTLAVSELESIGTGDAVTLEITPYYIDDTGSEQICQGATKSRKFTLQ